jgi:hypothetical protein
MGDFLRADFRLSTMAAESFALSRPLLPAQKLGDRGTSQRRDTPGAPVEETRCRFTFPHASS